MILNLLNPAQGLDQTSVEAPKAAEESGAIVRGTLLTLVGGFFHIAKAADKGDANAPGAKIYAALNGDTDADVQFSGVIAAVEVSVNGQLLETSALDPDATFELDDYLTLGADGLYTNGVVNGDTIYGQLRSLPTRRLVNNRPDHASGLTAMVAKIDTAYVPQATVSA